MVGYDQDQTSGKSSLYLCFRFLHNIIPSICHLPLCPALTPSRRRQASQSWRSVSLSFSSISSSTTSAVTGASFSFTKRLLLTFKNAFISVVFDFSFSFVPSLPLPISPKPMGEIWCLAQWMDPSLPHSLFSVHISQTQVPSEAQAHWPKYLMGSSAWGPHVNSESTHMVYIVLSIHWKDGTCQASINSHPDVNFLIERKSDVLVRLFF